MADIIAELAAKAGVSPEMAGKGIGAILNLLKDKLPAGLFTQVQATLPNANGLMADAAQAQETSGGLMGAVSGAVGKLFGGGGAAEVVNKLSHLGFSADQVQKFLPGVMEFFKNNLPPDVLKQAGGSLPTGEAGG